MIQTTIGIEGMMCSMCESHINDAIRNHFSVKKVKANRKNKEAVVLSEEALDEEQIRSIIKETGYELTGITSEEYHKKGLFGR